MPRSCLAACLTLGLLAAGCGGMPPEQELKILAPARSEAHGGPPGVQAGGSDMTPQGRDLALVALARQQEAWLRSFLEEVKQRAAEGEATATDVAQVESRLAAAGARLAAVEGALAATCARYRELVGQPAPSCAQ